MIFINYIYLFYCIIKLILITKHEEKRQHLFKFEARCSVDVIRDH